MIGGGVLPGLLWKDPQRSIPDKVYISLKTLCFLLFILHTKTVVLEQESFRLWSILIQKLNIFSLFPKGSMDIKKEMGLVMHCN